MKLSTIFLSGLFIASHLIASEANHGVYYAELKALKNAAETQALFEQDIDGGSRTNQCNLGSYKSIFVLSDKERGDFALWDDWRKTLSLGTIKRKIMMFKKLSFIDILLSTLLYGGNDDIILVTHETMPALNDYVDSLAKRADISIPSVFVSLKKGFFSAFARKILAFKGIVVIGQQLLHDVSDEELEALVAEQIAHIKYNHTNKNVALNAVVCLGLAFLLRKDPKMLFIFSNSTSFRWFVIPVIASLFVSKRFAKQADIFACHVAEKANGIIKFYERLQVKDHARTVEFDEISQMIKDNAADISFLPYLGLLISYYLAKAEHCVAGVYNKFAYPTHQERIDAAKEYLAQQV